MESFESIDYPFLDYYFFVRKESIYHSLPGKESKKRALTPLTL